MWCRGLLEGGDLAEPAFLVLITSGVLVKAVVVFGLVADDDVIDLIGATIDR